MEFLSGLALVLLTLVGYSSGAVLAGKGRQATPGLLDLLVVVCLWILALSTRASLGKWLAIVFWLVAASFVSALLTLLRRNHYPVAKDEDSYRSPKDVRGLKRGWETWKAFAFRMGNYQGRAMLAFFYFLVVTPFGVIVRLFTDPLGLRRHDSKSGWVERRSLHDDLDGARRQF